MRSNSNFQHPSEKNLSNNSQTISVNSKLNKVSKHSSGLSMIGGLSLLSLGALFSNALVASGQEGIVFGLFAVGFSLIYYGVSQDNE